MAGDPNRRTDPHKNLYNDEQIQKLVFSLVPNAQRPIEWPKIASL